MAIELKRQLILNVGQMVQSQINIFVANRKRIRDMREAGFSRRVIDEGLGYDDQVDYYQTILADEKDKSVIDGDYISEIKSKISDFRKLVRAEKFKQEYQRQLEEIASGSLNIQKHIDFLEDELAGVFDVDLQDNIKEKIILAKGELLTSQRAIFKNQATLAEADKSESILDRILKDAKRRKGDALRRGDNEWASSLDIIIQSLKQQLATVKTEDSIRDFVADTLIDTNPIVLLNKINKQINIADSQNPVMIGGQRFDNALAYWENEKGQYLSSGKFFNDLTTFFQNRIDVTNLRSKDSLMVDLKDIKRQLERFVKSPDIADFRNQIQDTISVIIGYGADKIATNISNQAKIDYDFQSAARSLSSLNKWAGIDMTDYYNEVLQEVATLNFPQAQSILSNAESYLSKNVGATREQALDWAIQATPNLIVSPETLAETKPEEIAKGVAGVSEKAEIGKEVTIPSRGQDISEPSPAISRKLLKGSLVKFEDSPKVYLVESDKTLRHIEDAKSIEALPDTWKRVGTVKSTYREGYGFGASIKGDLSFHPPLASEWQKEYQ